MAGPNVLAQLRKRREKWVDLEDGRRVKFLRPTEIEYGKMLVTNADGQSATWSVGIEDVRRCVVDWEGFSEASILGADIAPTDVMVPFDKDLFNEMVSDDVLWVSKVANAILESVIAQVSNRELATKNSPPA